MADTILITEDDPRMAELLKAILESKGYATQWVENGEAALQAVRTGKPDLILLDVMLPKLNGYQVLELLKADPALKDIPVIFVTVSAETDHKVVGLRLGGYDYITKPFDIEELLARVESVMRIKNEHDNLRKQNQRLAELSMTDPLTGLYNRRFLNERLKEELDRARRYQYPISCLMVDLDNFKDVNDHYGHLEGDRVLQHIALFLKNDSRVVDIVVRYGGEEFLLVLPQTDLGGAQVVGERFRMLVENTQFVEADPACRLTVSLGASAFATNALRSTEELLKLADEALYEAKRSGKNRLVLAPQL
jgi:two-component system, cell cycle response regulator